MNQQGRGAASHVVCCGGGGNRSRMPCKASRHLGEPEVVQLLLMHTLCVFVICVVVSSWFSVVVVVWARVC